MKKLILSIFILINLSAQADNNANTNLIFKNTREGKSFFFHRKTFFGRWNLKRRVKKFSKEFTYDQRKEFINELSKNDFFCEEKLVERLNKEHNLSSIQSIRRKYYLYLLRKDNYFDDIALSNYLYFAKHLKEYKLPQVSPEDFKEENQKPLRLFFLKQKTGACFYENANQFFGQFKFEKKPIKKYLKNKFVPKAYKKYIYKAFKKETHKITLTNKNYFQKLLSKYS